MPAGFHFCQGAIVKCFGVLAVDFDRLIEVADGVFVFVRM
jgi:hypothetical protein